MSKELPHASLQCSDCGTTFRVTLKKGRVPSRPIPCPTCKVPITVREADIIHPGSKTASTAAGGDRLRQTQPDDVLRKTKLVKVDPEKLDRIKDPITGEVDPPTAEIDVGDIDSDSSAEEEPAAASAPAFGIVQRKKIGAREPAASTDGLGLTVGTPGVHVVKGEGRGARDNVFGGVAKNSFAIGRISTKQVNPVPRAQINPEDPDLPAIASEAEEIDGAPAPRKPGKLDLSRLRKMRDRLEAEMSEAASEAESSEPTPAVDLDLPFDEVLSEVSAALDAASESEPIELDDLAQDSEELDQIRAQEEDDDSDEAEVEPIGGTLEVESEAYELGAAVVPARIPDPPKGPGVGGVLVGLLVLVIAAAMVYFMML